jgi:hypothetical protein
MILKNFTKFFNKIIKIKNKLKKIKILFRTKIIKTMLNFKDLNLFILINIEPKGDIQ